MESDIADRLRRYFVTQRNQWNAADEIERLRAERDEARRWFCFEARQASDRKNSEIRAKEIADIFFWDCFKENTND